MDFLCGGLSKLIEVLVGGLLFHLDQILIS